MDTRSPSLNEVNMGDGDGRDEMSTASLSEVLASRNRFLEEDELWALCHECCLTLEYVHKSHDLFQSISLNPETVAFDREGNVCFLDLDAEPESLYVAPENVISDNKSYKSHLFSLGMTLLFATEYNTESDDPSAELSDTFTSLLMALTNDDPELRPDLQPVIEACDQALGKESSQNICLRIIGSQSRASPGENDKSESSIQKMSEDLEAYLKCQTHLVRPTSLEAAEPTKAWRHEDITQLQDSVSNSNNSWPSEGKKDLNDNCVNKTDAVQSPRLGEREKRKGRRTEVNVILQDTSCNEDEKSENQDGSATLQSSQHKQGILLTDLLSSLERYLEEPELWALCKESVIALQRKRKHLPAYISPDTLILRDSGTVCFKAVPEKPLEMIYMSPELQQKGTLNEKTCLYGLGITLRSAAGVKYSTSLKIPDGEALEILVKSFLHENPDKRPNLETAFEMCEEYEKVSETKSRQVCIRMYREALKIVDAIAEPEHISSGNSLSLEDTTHREDNAEDIPYHENQDDSVIPSKSRTEPAFKPNDAAVGNKFTAFSKSAFSPVAIKTKLGKDLDRVPSAFSSPATHFKPIVLHDTSSPKSEPKATTHEQTAQTASRRKGTKDGMQQKEIKHNQGKQKTSEHTNKTSVTTKFVDNKQFTSITTQNKSNDLGYTLQQLQSQGHFPSTELLASAIAQYLRSQLTEPDPKNTSDHLTQGQNTSISTSTSDLTTTNGIRQPLHFVPSSSSHSYTFPQSVVGQSLDLQQHLNTVLSIPSATGIMSTQQIPYSRQELNIQKNVATYDNSSANFADLKHSAPNSKMDGIQLLPATSSHPFVSFTSGMPKSSHYPVPFSGMPSPIMPIQFTLAQDPTTGLMQMMPVPYLTLSQSQSSQGVPVLPHYSQGVNTLIYPSTGGTQLQNLDFRSDRLPYYSQEQGLTRTTSEKLPGSEAHAARVKTNMSLELQLTNTNDGDGYPRDGSNSLSPSKDGTVSVQPAKFSYSEETVTQKLLRSENPHKHRTLSNVIRILREAFTESGSCDIGAEDLEIAEYIISLSSLTWETFHCAVTEKYFYLLWTYDLLAVLYQAAGGIKKPERRNSLKTPPAAATTYKSSLSKSTVNEDYKSSHSGHNIGHFEQNQTRQPFNQQSNQQVGRETQMPSLEAHSLMKDSVPITSGSRPKSETRKQNGMLNETFDFTDSLSRNKERHLRKSHQFDKTKSLSMYNITGSSHLTTPEQLNTKEMMFCQRESGTNSWHMNQTELLNPANSNVFSKDYNQAEPLHPTNYSVFRKDYNQAVPLNPTNPSVFSKDYNQARMSNNFATNNPQSSKLDQKTSPVEHFTSVSLPSSTANFSPNSQVKGETGSEIHQSPYGYYNSPPMSVTSHSSSKSSGSQEHPSHNFSHHSETQSYTSHQLIPSAPAVKSQYAQMSPNPLSHALLSEDFANSPKEQSSPQKHYHQQQQQLDHSYSQSDSSQQHSTHPESKNIEHNSSSNDDRRLYKEFSATPRMQRQLKQPSQEPTLQSYNLHKTAEEDFSVSSSAEMRRVAAQKPELYHDQRSGGTSSLTDNDLRVKQGDSNRSVKQKHPVHEIKHRPMSQNEGYLNRTPHNMSNHLDSNASSRHNEFITSSSIPKNKDCNSNVIKSFSHFEPSHVRTRSDKMEFNNSQGNHGRSLSAVYNWQSGQSLQAFDISKSNVSGNQYRRGSDGSVQLPEMNHALVPFTKKGHVVYHSAMIQLSLTPEVDSFIHSIDEENKSAIDRKLASIVQENSLLCKQRKKTHMLYKKISAITTTGKHSKGDQNVSDQMMRDMTEMTKKLSFLRLCQTHLQMLLAELYGLDKCFLYSLSASEGNSTLNLQPYHENPYLQFRTVSTPQAEQMVVLQSGTPKGLMSYLYTSSALSDGYIHQFLLCFRYILTADQFLTFILDRCKSALSSNQRDANMISIQHRSVDLFHFWLEGYYSIDFSPNKRLIKKLADFLKELVDANVEGADNLYSLYGACKMRENSELMYMIDMDEDGIYFPNEAYPKRLESFRSLLKRSKSDKSNCGSSSSLGKIIDESNEASFLGSHKSSSSQFSIIDCPSHILAEQLTLMEQEYFRKCHPVHFLNTQSQGVEVALSMPGLRTPSMTRKSEASGSTRRGLFVGEPFIDSHVVQMITHAQELTHWVSAEILSCGSNKGQIGVITKFLDVAHLCLDVRNYASALAILDGLEHLMVRQLIVWKHIRAKYMTFMDELTAAKMKLKSEPMWLMSEKDCHIYPTIPCALYIALHLQQAEIGSFTLANGTFKWDKMRSISEIVDQLRIFRDHEYGFKMDIEMHRTLQRHLNEYSEQDLHAVASTQDNNFRRRSSSSSLSGTLKKVKDKFHLIKK